MWLMEMPKRTYDSSLFQVNENGFLTYDSDKYTSKIGIDVSRYQGSIDWAAVKDAGVEFAMLRLGYRGIRHRRHCKRQLLLSEHPRRFGKWN